MAAANNGLFWMVLCAIEVVSELMGGMAVGYLLLYGRFDIGSVEIVYC